MEKAKTASVRSEAFLVWLFLRNVREVRRNPTRFNAMFNQQKRIRERIGWDYQEESDAQMLDTISKEHESLKERFAFGDIDLDSEEFPDPEPFWGPSD